MLSYGLSVKEVKKKMNRVFILDKICLNVDNETDVQNLIRQGAKEIKDLSIFKGYESLVSPTNTVVNDDGSITFIAPQEKTLEELKADKLSELASITSKYDNQLVNTDMIINSSLGFAINADLRSQLNIHRLINIGAEPVSFVIANNTTVDLSIAQLNILISECEENMQYLFELKQSYKQQIVDATTKKELNAIKFEFTMKDFS